MTRNEAEIKLKKIFGFDKFYNDQWTVIEKLLSGQRILLIEKTGYGKSLCYQFPATQFEGTTIIFSPLIALMRDQVQKLQNSGYVVKAINSNQSDEENNFVIQEAIENKIKILYIAPERMENISFRNVVRTIKISMVVVDEAHCISVWGHDFRTAYRKIIDLVKLLPVAFPVLATTATATKKVQEDVLQQIGKNVLCVRGSLLRHNLELSVIHVNSEDEKMIWIGQNINKLEGTGIIYCGTQITTDIYSKWLEYLKINAIAYNGGLDPASRQAIEFGLINNSYKCVVSTNALGMGIDKPDIRFIIHVQTPQSPIHYYQEIGRAGRDNLPSKIILFFNPNDDLNLPKAFIEGGRPSLSKYQKVINVVKENRLGERQLIKATNLKQNQLRVIKADLIEQGIINEVVEGKSKKYEYKFGAPNLNTQAFEELRQAKFKDLDEMIKYINLETCRMRFLCEYLGDIHDKNCMICDNDTKKQLAVNITEEWTNKLEEYRNTYFPILEVASGALVDGVAASYYGVSNVGQAIHRSKYENGGDFPDFLLKLTLKAFRKHYGQEKFDLVVYVPPTISGSLVKNFAEKIARVLNFPISHQLQKTRVTQPQKEFQNGWLKNDNVQGAFTYQTNNELIGKNILLIDDIFDSGHTIKEIGKILSNFGALKIAPLVIAKTIGSNI